MNLALSYPWVLLALAVSAVPPFMPARAALRFSSLALMPADRTSGCIAILLRGAQSASLALVAIGLSAPFIPESTVERLGEGAQIVLLLDRSRSMDQPFGGHRYGNPLMTRDSAAKGTVARRLLTRFVAGRRNDKYGMLAFSTEPIQVLPLTDRRDAVLAAIEAGNIGRGLTETDVGAGILRAAGYFEDQPYTGSRVILLVSDGGARLDTATRVRIADSLRRNRIALYWVYLRSRNSPGIIADGNDPSREDTAPARVLHDYFASLETPYRVFDAEDPEALSLAIRRVNELQSLPIRYVSVVPREYIADWFYAAAMAAIALLLACERMEIRQW